MKLSKTIIIPTLIFTLHGVFVSCTSKLEDYYDSGKTKSIIHYKKMADGQFVKQGKCSWFYENGNKELEISFVNGKEEGIGTSWFESGAKKGTSHYKNGQKHGLSISFYEDGKKKEEGTFKDGHKDGKFLVWYENGMKNSEVNYKMGKNHGNSIYWFSNGKKKAELPHKDDIVNGRVRMWFSNGQLMRDVTFVNGNPDKSTAMKWDSTGTVIVDKGNKVLK